MSNFQVEFGKDSAGNTALQTVPVFYGDQSRQVAQIIRGNSENALPTVPAMACYINTFQYDRERVQEPYHISKMRIRERSYDPLTDTWGHGQGDAFSIERPMPVPYKLTLNVDIWTSNTEQKLQLLEQMVPLFNPAFEIQSTDNYVDWTSLSAIYLKDTRWTSRTVPMGGDDTSIDIATLTFELPIWLSLPAKVKKLGVIEKIFLNLWDAQGDLSQDITQLPVSDLLAQRIITPLNYGVIYYNNLLQLFQPQNTIAQTLILTSNVSSSSPNVLTFADTSVINLGDLVYGPGIPFSTTVLTKTPTSVVLSNNVNPPLGVNTRIQFDTLQPASTPPNSELAPVIHNGGDTYAWKTLVDLYGYALKNGITTVRLDQPNGSTVVGTVSYHPSDPTLLLFSPFIDTIPANNLAPVNAIIDPDHVDVDSTFLNATAGTRYLILRDIGSTTNIGTGAVAWRGTDNVDLVAKANDIIQYTGAHWFVAFAAAQEPSIKYTTNLRSGIQYKWIASTQTWNKAIEGTYNPGDWTIVLT